MGVGSEGGEMTGEAGMRDWGLIISGHIGHIRDFEIYTVEMGNI